MQDKKLIVTPPENKMYPLFLNDDINATTYQSFAHTLGAHAAEEKRNRILLNVSSKGGEGMEALCIVDTLKAWPHPVAVICGGMNASAATYVVAAGDIRLAYSHAHFLMHPATNNIGYSNKAELNSGVRYLEGLDESWSTLYQECIGLTKKEVDKLCSYENYLNAHTALNLGTRGLIDGIILKLLDGFKYEILMRGGVRKVVDLANDDYNDIRNLTVDAVKDPSIVEVKK